MALQTTMALTPIRLVLLAWCCIRGAEAHGYLAVPRSRNVVHQKGPKFPQSAELGAGGDISNLNAGIGGGVEGQAKEHAVGHGLCGDDVNGNGFGHDRFMTPGPYGYSAATVNSGYVEGGLIDIEVKITAYHKGWFEFRLCDRGAASAPVTQACFNQHVLKFDEAYTKAHPSGHKFKNRRTCMRPLNHKGCFSKKRCTRKYYLKMCHL